MQKGLARQAAASQYAVCSLLRPAFGTTRSSIPKRFHGVLPTHRPSAPACIPHFISIAMASASAAPSAPSGNQLLIVGPGVLGSCLGKLWLDGHGAGTVIGQTNTTTNHAMLQGLGITPRTADQAPSSTRYPYVAFCAPPSGSEDYVASVKAALAQWDGSGAFVFTSSAAVYAVTEGECVESSPTVPVGASERTDRLVLAEQAVLEAGGCVARLVGLYHKTRGAHTFFLKQGGEVPRWGGGTINLIHYQDAAGMCLAILTGQGSGGKGHRGQAFLGCDNSPVTFQAMMDSIAESGVLEGGVTFTGPAAGSPGKTTRNDVTRRQLEWEPRFGSIQEFFAAGGEDWYSANSETVPKGAGHA